MQIKIFFYFYLDGEPCIVLVKPSYLLPILSYVVVRVALSLPANQYPTGWHTPYLLLVD